VRKKLVFLSLFICSVLVSTASLVAGAYCNNEKITSLTMTGDSIFFTTDKS
jgi:hypothetical protein